MCSWTELEAPDVVKMKTSGSASDIFCLPKWHSCFSGCVVHLVSTTPQTHGDDDDDDDGDDDDDEDDDDDDGEGDDDDFEDRL